MSPRKPKTEPPATAVQAADPLAGFGKATRAWFTASFEGATRVQREGWPHLVAGQHALLCAPTGSGKTLAAFLASLDKLTRSAGKTDGVRVLYVSPLKALAYDIERNLRAPLHGIELAAQGVGETLRNVRTAIRTGDTPARERRLLGRDPSDVLITTPESLYLLLGSDARRILTAVETIIVDEIHALAPTKRGAHLALSLERLASLVIHNGGVDPQRIGLSATQRPLEEVARFLGGSRPVTIVDAGEKPRLDLRVEVPVDDLEQPPPITDPSPASPERPRVGAQRLAIDATSAEDRRGIWPALHDRVLELVAEHRSTIVFTNSRRLCERLAQRLNELWTERGHDEILVRAHHGSIAREQRVEIEELLKQGQLRGIVATSSLELGIDMGAVDLVIQIESPGSVSRGLQRVGRAGHSIGSRSDARVLPKFRQDLLEATVVAGRMLEGDVEPIKVPRNPLDVLSQQIVAMTADRPHTVDEIERVARGAYPYQTLSRELLVAVLDMLAGRYPADELGDLRPRVIWDRNSDEVVARKDAKLIAIVNAGTIPDRGMFGVHLEGGGPRVGELDEEMVHESRVGQTFLLGASSWRITEITRDRVIVRPAPGEPGRMPFWRGEGPGRPIELGRAMGKFLREIEPDLGKKSARTQLQKAHHLDARAAENLCRYLEEQRAATTQLPSDRVLIVERFRDELGDWRVCLLSPFGARVHAPLALALEAKLRERTGAEAQALHSDDGIVLRVADSEAPPALSDLLPDPEELEDLVLAELRGSSLFATHFRENAGRALLLPRRRPGKRTPLWTQRLKAQTLLEVASKFPGFPIVLETFRECYNDVFDVPALVDLLGALRSRQVRLVEVETPRPSPFAKSLAFAYVAAYLYEGDSPLAERKAQALTLDRDLLRELLGEVEARSLLDATAIAQVEAELQSLAEDRHVRSADGVHDLLRRLGDLSPTEVAARTDGDVTAMLDTLQRTGRAIPLRLGSPTETRWVAIEDCARYRDALGVPLPAGVPKVYLEPAPSALESLLDRWARTHGPFTIADLASRFALTQAQLRPAVRLAVVTGRWLEGAFRPEGGSDELCDPEVLRKLRRQTLAKLRSEIAPVDPSVLARFLPAWHGLGGDPARGTRGVERLREALFALEGLAVPFSELEEKLLPARVPDYQPRLLDELGAAGEIVWIGRGALGSDDGKVSIYFRDHIGTLVDLPAPYEGEALHALILEQLKQRGAAFFAQLQQAAPTTLTSELEAALWDLVWAGQVTNDTFAPLRALALPKKAAKVVARRAGLPRPSPTLVGRWSLASALHPVATEPTAAAHARALMLLERYGVVMREAAAAEELPGGFGAVSGVLRAMEEAGRVRRGYFIEGLAGAQYALPGALDRLRSARSDEDDRIVVMSAIDPASPFGLFVPWPEVETVPGETPGRPRRSAGALVVVRGARAILFLERGGKKLLIFERDADAADPLPDAIAALQRALRQGQRPRFIRIAEVNGRPALRSIFAGELERAGFRVEPGGLVLDA